MEMFGISPEQLHADAMKDWYMVRYSVPAISLEAPDKDHLISDFEIRPPLHDMRSKYEKETIILFNEGEDEARIYTHNARMIMEDNSLLSFHMENLHPLSEQ